MTIISAPVVTPDAALGAVRVRAERLQLAKRIWRTKAEDGTEFGFELAVPLRHGEVCFQTASARYVIEQQPEALLEVALDIAPSAAAGIGWAVGNLHLELQAEPARLLALDEPAVRNLLERLKVPYRPVTAIFRPGRFSRGHLPTHELGPSHQH